ncbi:MAG: complex I NDUFA9 subunit family protein [Betaproteobacteria bacterium]|nr:complex I NDUFA9 subunit family protein [Betaproteobacteria bacterium]NBY14351.1 complex I NDUFA9 subunit family protein [Betaproteobacteria bacterium]NCA15943.1 complex I NDUFA9 subunit family protein [Betaproteobacteria bacterium]NDF03890.1 complex I NDUFA9 subunit family protein [Betaproteobacteria bacterium]
MTHATVDVAILGGSGFIGQALAASLVKNLPTGRLAVRVITRAREKCRDLWSLPGIEVVEVDTRQEPALAEALTGAQAVVNLVGVLHSRPGRPWGPEFDEAHVKLPSRLARCMTSLGIRRLIHISALGVSDHAPSMYLRSKAAGEAALRGTINLDLTVLRPSVVFGPKDQFLNLFARLQRFLPVVPLATPHARFQPIYVNDLVTAIGACLHKPSTAGRVLECVGPDVLSLYEIVHWAGEYSGHPRPILPLPDGVSWLQALVMEHLPGPPLLSRDNLASATVPNVASGPMDPDLDLPNPVSLHSVAPQFLGEASDRASAGRFRRRRTPD